jgi:hypothetical protein
MPTSRFSTMRRTVAGCISSGAGGEVEYVAELELDAEDPYYETEAPETGDGPLRRVYVFKFHPVTGNAPSSRSKLDGAVDPGVPRFRSRTVGLRGSSSAHQPRSTRRSAASPEDRRERGRRHSVCGRVRVRRDRGGRVRSARCCSAEERTPTRCRRPEVRRGARRRPRRAERLALPPSHRKQCRRVREGPSPIAAK